ncbi:MAG: choice-of-anchor J domain-containing protein, partial [Bacteroidales bacterium]|nr:choice-of-anchor J domain-containing protein [Bacteroidales bacterium]
MQNTYDKVAISFAADSLLVEDVSVPEGTFARISMNGYGFSYNPGAPQLPQLTKLMQIPVCDSVVAAVVDADFEEYDAVNLGIHHPLYPSQVSVSKTEQNPPFSYNQLIYFTNTFYALPLVSVEKSGIRRNVALANVYVSPVQYNPVTNKIRIYTKIDVEFTFVNTNLMMTQKLEKYSSPMFELDAGTVINKMQNAAKNEYTGAPIKYLIIANSMFSSNTDLTAFVEWKRRLGYKVELAFTSDANVGTTTTSIKNFIQNKYNNATAADPAPTFLLLIGDVAQLPAFDSQFTSSSADNDHVTDLYYATLAGNDNIPDCYYGRLSATNSTQLSNQIAKIMMYEQYTMPDPSYLGNAVLIAGTDGNGYSPTHADGQVNYIYNNYINTSSTTHNFTTVYKHNYNCSSQAATIRSEINAGVSIANYTAHGSSSGWADPAFTTSHVSSMTNTNKYGLLIGNCCLSGKFDDSECFGESLLRAANKGAMGYIGASNSSYWNEDVYWAVGVRSSINANMSYDASKLGTYDKWFHTHNEAYTNWVSTIGGIIQGGNLSVQSSSSSRKLYYWEIYHCFGDPSVRVYMGIPNTMTVTASDITLDESQYTVTAVPYAYVALKKNTTELVAAAFANASGVATLSLPGNLEAGTYELVVLAQNYIWYHQNVEAIEVGSCISPSNFTVSNVTPFTADLSWTGVSGEYSIQLKAGNGNWTSVATGVTTTTYTLSGLQDDTEYQVRIQSVCGSETSGWRTQTFATPIACPIPTGLVCTNYTATTASLSWTENGSANNWTLQYGTNSNFASGTYTQVTVSGNPSTILTGLIVGTNYYARVKSNCGSIYGESQWSDACSFLPLAIITIGSGTSTSNYLPTNNYYKYSLTQQIYTVSELGEAAVIHSLAFYKNSTMSCVRDMDIYMVSTTKNNFSSSSDWISVTASDKVFSGTVTFASNDWTTIELTTPFAYDGTMNVAIIVDDNTGSYVSNTPFLVYSATSQAMRIYSDNTNYSAISPSSYSGTVESKKNQIRIMKSPICLKPVNVVASNITGSSAMVSWTGEADSYNVRYRTAGNDDIYFFDDFENGISNWTVIRSGGGTESTDWHQFDPHNFSSGGFDAYSGSYVVIGRSWASDAYNVDNWLITPAVTLNGTLKFWVRDDGNYHEHYDVYVSTGSNAISDFSLLYSPGDASSTWTEISVDLTAYHGTTGYIALRLTDEDQNYLMIDDFGIYSNGSPAGEWQPYVTSTSNSTSITGLSPLTEYEVEVQADCGEEGESVWTNPVYFTTDDTSIIPTYININGNTVVCPGATTVLTSNSDVEGTYTWSTGATGAQVIVEAGTYTVTITSTTGNQLSNSVTVTEYQPMHIAITEIACESYTWNGTTYTESGVYTYTHEDVNGCIQVDTLHLTIHNPVHTAIMETACESYTWNGTTYTESGVYTYSHADANGCTQVDTLHLTINNPVHTAITETACESYTWNGTTYTESGDYTYSHKDANGCTRVDTLHLTINDPVHTAVTETACESYTWNGTTYTTSGDYTYSHKDANGCTQVDTLHLTINNPVHTAVTETTCESYTWNGTTYTTSGDYTYSHEDANGCTQVDTLHLTINNPVHTAVTETACESYTWNGTTYTESGDYTYSHKDANGCTQVDTLHLTINHATNVAMTVDTCDWYSWNGETYTASGTYYYTHDDANNCTQVDTLYLTINHATNIAVTVDTCDWYSWNGETYTASGTYYYTHDDANNCTQVDTLYLTINHATNVAVTVDTCDWYSWNGETYTTSGTYYYTHDDANNCTQVDTLYLTINNPVHTAVTEEACESFVWNGTTYTESGDYIHSHLDDNGCTQVDTLHLTINNPVHTAVTEEACESFIWNGTTYTESGDYTYSHADANGCIQVDTLHLTINNPVHTAVTEEACESFVWNGTTYTESGDYTHSHADANGCTQVDTLHLTINNPVHTAVTEVACESFTWNGTEYTTSGDYTYSHADANGCIQVDTLHLTINNPVHTATTGVACESFVWNGVTYTESGEYTYSHADANGCTQVDTLHLTINNPIHTAVTETACESFIWNNTTYTESGDFTYSHEDANGCIQVDTLHLTINNSVHNSTTEVACENYMWNGTTYTESGDYTHSHADANGCTQVDTLHLTINNPVHTAVTETACESFIWNNTTYTESGDYTFSHEDANGCTQVDTLHLTINNPVHTVTTEVACENYTWNGETYTESGDYTYSHEDANGCIQVDTLHLTINNPVHIAVTETACESFIWNNTTYTESGDFTYSHEDANGCTQVDTLHLTINNPVHTATIEVAYDTYTWVNGNGETYNVSGTYYYTHPDVNTCIQVDTLYLTVYYSSTNDFAAVACEAYEWDDSVYTMTGDYTREYQDVHGADSVVTLHLRINHGTHNAMIEMVCNSYEWHGETYSVSGTYTYAYENADGCPSVDTLHLTVNYSNIGDTIAVACNSFDWYEYTNLTQSDEYTHTFTNAAGCDSVVTLHLTINNPVHTATTEVACETFVWNGMTYTESGDYTHSHEDANGCIQVDTLHLTINNPVHTAVTETACESFIWNNTTYTESGDYTFSHEDVNGCIQVDTLHLTINNPVHTATTEVACESFVWNGMTYTESGVYTYSHEDVNGCIQVDTLHLTINNPVHTTTTEVACENFVWNGTTYTESGDYTFSHEDANGCTQVDTLHLTI